MKMILLFSVMIFSVSGIFAQRDFQKIYETEKAFEKAVAEKGINQAFIEFSAPDGTCFFSGYPVNCIEYFKTQPSSPAALFWNPTFIDVSANGAIAYSTGNSVYKRGGKDDSTAFYGEYVTVWVQQPNGSYKVVIDLGISHPQPNTETKWSSPPETGGDSNETKFSAAHTLIPFFQTAAKQGLREAYQDHLADDVRLLREGKMPFTGKQNAFAELKKNSSKVALGKNSVYIGSADLAYVTGTYAATGKNGKEIEKGSFLQIWKLRGGRWQIVLDAFVPAPPEKN